MLNVVLFLLLLSVGYSLLLSVEYPLLLSVGGEPMVHTLLGVDVEEHGAHSARCCPYPRPWPPDPHKR